MKRIRANHRVYRGKPIIRGTRVSAEMILDLLSQGVSEEEILEDYPMLEKYDIKACLAYAKALVANEDL